MLLTWVVDYADSAVSDHPSTTSHSAVAITETAHPLLPPIHDLYVLTPTTPLSNVEQHYCVIFDTTLFQYLKQLIFNVEKTLV